MLYVELRIGHDITVFKEGKNDITIITGDYMENLLPFGQYTDPERFDQLSASKIHFAPRAGTFVTNVLTTGLSWATSPLFTTILVPTAVCPGHRAADIHQSAGTHGLRHCFGALRLPDHQR